MTEKFGERIKGKIFSEYQKALANGWAKDNKYQSEK